MKNSITFFAAALLVFCNLQLRAQNTFPNSGAAGIGTTTPASSSLLEVKSTTKGLLIPRMTKAQRDAIASPVEGLLIYQTNNTPGFYYYSSSAWTAISSKDASKNLNNLTAPTAVNADLLPGSTATTDLGSSSMRWRNAYINNIKFADGTTQSTAGGGGGSIGGSGTANYLSKFSGTTTLGNSLLWDDGTKLVIGTNSFFTGAKFNIDQSTNSNTVNLLNQMTGSSPQLGIYNYVGGTTGNKIGVSNDVGATSTGTGTVTGTKNFLSNSGSGIGYGEYNELSGTSAAAQYGTYTYISNSGSGDKYGSYVDLGLASGTKYGYYLSSTNSSGNMFGGYFNFPTTSSYNKYGLYINIPSTSGTNIGIYSLVSSSNTNSYSGFFSGKTYFTGNVGIGTLIPAALLHLDGGGTDASLSGGGYLISGSTTSTNIVMDDNEIMARNNGAASTLYVNHDGGDLNLCYASGNVMIGASVPATGYLLSVDGKIMCEELKVQLSQNWPDYVFDEKYKMLSISDMKSFVKTNKHLPGIPSASEMKENGISVGEMQTKMMQKIEEMSLYIIELQNQIDELKGKQ